MPAGYTLDSARTATLQGTVTGATSTISVYVKDSTEMAIVCKGTIYAPTDCNRYLMPTNNLSQLEFKNFDTSNVTSMNSMLKGEWSSLDLSTFNTINVMDTACTFQTASSNLTNLNLTGWNLSNVTIWAVENPIYKMNGTGIPFWGMFDGVNSNIVITCSQATKDILMAHNGTGENQIGITLTDANFNVV